VVAQVARDAEHQVVPRLVGEEERLGRGEERRGFLEPLDVHERMLYLIGNA
jgi:hypothetical protein